MSGTAYQMMSHLNKDYLLTYLPPLRLCQPSGSIWRHSYLFRCCYNTVWYCSYLLWL